MASVVTSTTAEWSVHFVPKGTRPPAPAHFHLIGTAGDGHYHQLAISSGREGWIKLHCRRLNGSFEASVTRPSDGLIRVQGIRQARKIAMRAFRDNALNGIEHYGRPIGEVYRRHPEYEHCRLFVEWSMFLDDIKGSFFITQDRFIQLLLQTSTHINRTDQNRIAKLTAQEFVTGWRETLQQLCSADNTWDEEDLLHKLALLRRILELSGGCEDIIQRSRFLQDTAPVDRLTALGMSINVEGTTHLDVLDLDEACCFLNRCEVFKTKPITEEDMQDWEEKLYVHVLVTAF
ncbi:hypothetical protein F5B18DRAFT_224452 [Nemania serpens]|nr:hypothetical protein F5B18DRAFT_224452 [Nemania serpens]